jgi:methylated-DNA-[protein]-cysteine S-methyltransferase
MIENIRSNVRFDYVPTPFKHALVAVDDRGALVQLTFFARASRLRSDLERPGARRDSKACETVSTQLTEYFEGKRRTFDLDVAPRGSEFELRVWRALLTIPYGETASYLDLSRIVGPPSNPRNIGAANGANPIAIVIPCHRIIGHDGKLVGYGGGLQMKQYLLDLEQQVSRLRPHQLALM